MARALRYEGLLPHVAKLTPELVGQMRAAAEAGATWWIESPWDYGDDHDRVSSVCARGATELTATGAALAIYSSAGPESGGRPSGAAARRWSSHASSASVRFRIRRLASDMRVASDADAASRLRRSTKMLTTPDPKIASSSSQKPRTPTIHSSAATTTKTRTRNSV